MKWLYMLVLILGANMLYAQSITGVVFDKDTQLPVANATVKTFFETVRSNTLGTFHLTGIRVADTASVTCVGYKPYHLVLGRYGKADTLKVYLERYSVVLRPVTVKAQRNFKLDSANNRKAFASVFARKAPGVKDAFVPKASLAYIPNSYINAPNNTTSLVGINVLSTIGLFRKNKTQVSRLQKTLLRDEELKFADQRFGKQKVTAITGLKGDSLFNFIDTYRLPVSQLKEMTEYDLITYIKKSYTDFIGKNPNKKD